MCLPCLTVHRQVSAPPGEMELYVSLCCSTVFIITKEICKRHFCVVFLYLLLSLLLGWQNHHKSRTEPWTSATRHAESLFGWLYYLVFLRFWIDQVQSSGLEQNLKTSTPVVSMFDFLWAQHPSAWAPSRPSLQPHAPEKWPEQQRCVVISSSVRRVYLKWWKHITCERNSIFGTNLSNLHLSWSWYFYIVLYWH